MKKHSGKLLAFIAFILTTSKGKTEQFVCVDEDKVHSIIEEIRAEIQTNPELLLQMMDLKKPQLEESLDLGLIDCEFVAIHTLMNQLLNEGVVLEPTSPGKTVIATQEYAK